MLKSEPLLPQEIYWRHLETVSDIKFTSREMEVVSCIYETRLKTKEIAAFLSIAPKTIGTHITNIMGKMDCSSREAIIEFTKKSGKSSFIKNHYLTLKIRNHFEQQLKKIRWSTEKPHCEIIDWVGQEDLLWSKLQKYLKNQLKEHLELVSINVNQTTKNNEEFIHYREEAKHPTFHIMSKILCEQQQTNENRDKIEVYQLTQTDPDNAIFLLVERKTSTALPKEVCENSQKDFINQRNYYFAAFEILKSLFPDVIFNKIIVEFKGQCELIHNGSEETNYPLLPKLKKVAQKNHRFQNLWKGMLENKLMIISILCSILPIFFFILASPISQKQVSNKTQFIRSDLPLPAEVAFLKRPGLVKQIKDKLKGKDGIQTVALVGMGGMGKTTIARYFGRSQAGIVWEINAESKDSLITSFKDLGYALAQTKEQKEELDFIQKCKILKKKRSRSFHLLNMA